MVEYKIGYFEEKKGVKSYTRLTSFIAFIIAMLLIIYSVFYDRESFDIIVALLTYSGGQKIAQKFTENK